MEPVPTAASLSIESHDDAQYACTMLAGRQRLRECVVDRGSLCATVPYQLRGLTRVQWRGIQGDKDVIALSVVSCQAKLPSDHLSLLDMQGNLHQAPQLEPAHMPCSCSIYVCLLSWGTIEHACFLFGCVILLV